MLDICEHIISAVALEETVYRRDMSFCAELVDKKQHIDVLRGLRYKLRMTGIPISGPLYTYRDNMSVVHKTSRTE